MHKLFNTDFVLNISSLTTFIYLEWKKHEVHCSSLLKCFEYIFNFLKDFTAVTFATQSKICIFEISDLHFSSLLCQLLFIVSYNTIFLLRSVHDCILHRTSSVRISEA